MTKTLGPIHVATIRNRRVDKSGQPRKYVSYLPGDLIEMIGVSLAGEVFVPAAAVATVARSGRHGHVVVVRAQA